MNIRTVKRIANKWNQIYNGMDAIVTRLDKNKIEIRSELTSYEGGNEMSFEISETYPEWICENQGGCIYILYRPL